MGVRIENLSLQDFIINIGENLENTNKDQEGASPNSSHGLTLRGVCLYSVVWMSKFQAEGEVVHMEVTGDTGQVDLKALAGRRTEYFRLMGRHQRIQTWGSAPCR